MATTLTPIITGTPGELPHYNIGMAETFSWIPIDNNANRDLYCHTVRSLWIESGECVTSYISGITNQSRIQLDYCSTDSMFVFENFNAENHQNNVPLVTFTNSTAFASIKFINCCFESFNNSAVSICLNP